MSNSNPPRTKKSPAISSRESLIDALHLAAELEHGLMLQYMFAAMSMKKRLDEALTGGQQEAVRDWEGRILGVMREEMAHLGTVCNLLTAIGGAPRFDRPSRTELAWSLFIVCTIVVSAHHRGAHPPDNERSSGPGEGGSHRTLTIEECVDPTRRMWRVNAQVTRRVPAPKMK
jgi:hypothetical protein